MATERFGLDVVTSSKGCHSRLDYLWLKQPQDAAAIAVYRFLNPLTIVGHILEGYRKCTSQEQDEIGFICLYERVKLRNYLS